MGRVGASGRVFEERCLRHRELDGHVTPKRVPYSNQGSCMGTC